jgi:hypothetical protein
MKPAALNTIATNALLGKRKKDEQESRDMYNATLKENADWLIEQCKDSSEYWNLQEKVESARHVIEGLRKGIHSGKAAFRLMEKNLQIERGTMDEAAKEEYEVREEYLRERDALALSTQGISARYIHCQMPFDPASKDRRVCSIIQPTGYACKNAGPHVEACGCNVTKCQVCGEWLCPECKKLHARMDGVRCGYWGMCNEYVEFACHKLPHNAYHASENGSFEFPDDWIDVNCDGLTFCPNCIGRYRQANACHCGDEYDCECCFFDSPAVPRLKKEAQEVRNQLKEELPDFKAQQLLCYGNVIAQENTLRIGNLRLFD